MKLEAEQGVVDRELDGVSKEFEDDGKVTLVVACTRLIGRVENTIRTSKIIISCRTDIVHHALLNTVRFSVASSISVTG